MKIISLSNFFVSDIDECEDEIAKCKDGTYCHNTPGSYDCKGTYIYIYSTVIIHVHVLDTITNT